MLGHAEQAHRKQRQTRLDHAARPHLTEPHCRLAAIAQMADQPEVHLRPNKLVTYKHVAGVMASAQRLGVTKIGLVGNEQFTN